MSDVVAVGERIREESAFVSEIVREIEGVLVGQKKLVEGMLIGLLTGGHVLLEGVPGLAKSLAVACLAKAIRGSQNRVQFTPDLLPADLVGTEVYSPKTGEFSVKKGPIFTNLLLADEINRAPAKVQSALLEGMQERQVSIGGKSFPLPHPFLVLATQNPVEHEGTYPLPEAQVDRFALKVVLGYPTREEERSIVDRMARTGGIPEVRPVVDTERVLRARAVIDEIYVDDRIKDYVIALVFASREPGKANLEALAGKILYGASPRASILLTLAAKAHAFLKGRGYVTPADIKGIAMEVLRHRVIVTYEAEAEGITSEDVVRRILDAVPVP
ncbi:MAG TPA: MoxR family ATPase [Planctomycetota bacterium]|nr:MoxR family ATPase [Planctomycetota bacterium]